MGVGVGVAPAVLSPFPALIRPLGPRPDTSPRSLALAPAPPHSFPSNPPAPARTRPTLSRALPCLDRAASMLPSWPALAGSPRQSLCSASDFGHLAPYNLMQSCMDNLEPIS